VPYNGDPNFEGDLTLPSSNFIDLVPGNAGSLPTGVVVMNEQTTGTDFVYVPLAGTDPNQIQKRLASNPTLVDRTVPLNDSTGIPGLVFPTAIAARDQGDKVFTANFAEGSISPIDGFALVNQQSVPVGTNVERLVIQKKVCAFCLVFLVDSELSSANLSSFDRPAHQIAIVGEVVALEKLLDKKQASPQAVDAQVTNIVGDVNRWVVDLSLAIEVTGDLKDAGSLYRQEMAARN